MGELVDRLVRQRDHLGFGEVRSELGECPPAVWHWLLRRPRRLGRGDDVFLDGTLQNPVACEPRRARVAIRTPPFRRLRQRHEQCRLAERKPPPRLLPK
ncbi:MAG: hypothetical protein WDN31_10870 [Hyphomicrobium sp.]